MRRQGLVFVCGELVVGLYGVVGSDCAELEPLLRFPEEHVDEDQEEEEQAGGVLVHVHIEVDGRAEKQDQGERGQDEGGEGQRKGRNGCDENDDDHGYTREAASLFHHLSFLSFFFHF